MNVPNIISTFRIVSAPVLWLLIYVGNETAFTWLLTACFFSDAIDGYIARKLNQVSKLGSVLDSYGDSLTIISGVAGVIRFHHDLFDSYYFVLYIIVGIHLVQLMLALWKYGKPSAFHTWSAKLAAIAVGIFILITLHFTFVPWLFWLTTILLIVDAVEESILVLLIPKWKTDIRGLFWYLKNKTA